MSKFDRITYVETGSNRADRRWKAIRINKAGVAFYGYGDTQYHAKQDLRREEKLVAALQPQSQL